MAEDRDRSCYTCFHRNACASMMEAQGLADYVSLGAQSAERCPDYIYIGDVAPVRHARWVDNHCTACGMMPMGDEMWKHCDFDPPRFEEFMDYCPNCGAKMDLKEG